MLLFHLSGLWKLGTSRRKPHRRSRPLTAEHLEDRTLLSGFDDPIPLILDRTGSARQTGRIETPGQSEVYQFVAPLSGRLSVEETPSGDSSLLPLLRAFDDNRIQLNPYEHI